MVGFSNNVPFWLETLLGERFFNPCLIHETAKKNEKNIFCLDCCSTICPQCLPPHRPHRLLQIRRYVYHDVVRVDDLEKLIDCAFVQSYTTNGAKVVFLNERPQSRPFRGSGNICCSCDRTLQDPYLFCSLSCKVKHLARSEGGLSRYLYECDFLPLPISCDLDDGQLTPDSVLGSPDSTRSSGSSGGDGGGIGCSAGTEFLVRKKRSSIAQSARASWSEAVNRRKGVPSRAPMY